MKKILLFSLLSVFTFSCSSDDDGGTAQLPVNENCANPVQITSSLFGEIGSVSLDWDQDAAASFTVEYGELGFQLGSGTQRTTNESFINLDGLTPGTDYVYYIQANCGSDGVSQFAGPNGFTIPPCTAPTNVNVFQVQATIATISIDGLSSQYEVEYGVTGFSIGSGQVAQIFSTDEIFNLTPDTTYDIYARTICGGETSENSPAATFTTDTACRTPEFFSLNSTSSTRISVSWSALETAFEVEYGLVGFEIGSGTVIGTSNTFVDIEGLSPATTYEVYVRSNCGSEGMSNNAGPIVATTEN